MPRLTGVVNGLSDWIFAYPGRISVTVSETDLDVMSRQEIAHQIWTEVSYVTGRYIDRPVGHAAALAGHPREASDLCADT